MNGMINLRLNKLFYASNEKNFNRFVRTVSEQSFDKHCSAASSRIPTAVCKQWGWCEKAHCVQGQQIQVYNQDPEQRGVAITSNESSFRFWGKLNDAFNPRRLLLTVKHGSGAVKVRAAIYWGSLGLMIALHDCITAKQYEAILRDKVHPTVQMLPRDVPIRESNNAWHKMNSKRRRDHQEETTSWF